MREIKFRGKAKISEEKLDRIGIPHQKGWVFGHLVTSRSFTEDEYKAEIYVKIYEGKSVSLSGSSTYGKHHESITPIEVDINTVSQYIGFKEDGEFGEEIYEGDVVRVWGGSYINGCYEYDKELVVKDIRDLSRFLREFNKAENRRVVGNIYDTHILLSS